MLSAGFSYKFIGYFQDEKYNTFNREITLTEPLIATAYIRLMSDLIPENINCIMTSLEMHQKNGKIIKAKNIENIFGDLSDKLWLACR